MSYLNATVTNTEINDNNNNNNYTSHNSDGGYSISLIVSL